VQQLESLGGQFAGKNREAGDVAPGRARLGTIPTSTGSTPVMNTIGIVRVADLAARAAGEFGIVTIIATFR
jgi:hypothetical protein